MSHTSEPQRTGQGVTPNATAADEPYFWKTLFRRAYLHPVFIALTLATVPLAVWGGASHRS